MAARASGYGVYNDPAIAIAWLLEQGAERVAYVDIDAHHGDEVQAAFYADPRVLTISLHKHPATLFPFTGLPAETGGPGAEGSAVNVALPAGTGDSPWLRAFYAIVPPLLRQFRPQMLVSQHGCDTHRLDPLSNLELSIDAQRAAHAAIHALAHEAAGGRWLLTGGGGMSWSRWYRGPGPTCSPGPQASRSTQARRPPPDGVSTSRGAPVCRHLSR
jgi:acetoin utilization protein AcuC